MAKKISLPFVCNNVISREAEHDFTLSQGTQPPHGGVWPRGLPGWGLSCVSEDGQQPPTFPLTAPPLPQATGPSVPGGQCHLCVDCCFSSWFRVMKILSNWKKWKEFHSSLSEKLLSTWWWQQLPHSVGGWLDDMCLLFVYPPCFRNGPGFPQGCMPAKELRWQVPWRQGEGGAAWVAEQDRCFRGITQLLGDKKKNLPPSERKCLLR